MVLNISVMLFLWCVWCMVINLILFAFFTVDRFAIKIDAPKSKKYQGRVEPIYKLYQNDFTGGYYISKWEMKYSNNNLETFIMIFLFPYPIIINTYGYVEVGEVFGCKESEINHAFEGKELSEVYETVYQKENAEYLAKKKIKDDIESVINNLNKTFDENYIK